MFVDTAKVMLKAGKGGDGAVSFRHEIYIPKGGPDGGNGGKGGSIIFRADKDTNTLLDFRFNPELKAQPGKNGSGQRSAGRSGQDLIVEVPIGTVVKRDGQVIADLTAHGQESVVAQGGDGGFGNAHFKSSVRQTPRIAEVGEPGEEFEAELELKLLADVGLVGLPNAGKSTFLSVVSNAKPEIADYPFTTITPNLGVATVDKKDLLIADIPGLIAGASEGKGLGHAFLRHVDRTAVILHLVDVYNDDAGQAYRTIRAELEQYSDLAARPEIVALTKTEGLDQDIINLQISAILAQNPDARVFAISSAAHQGIEELLRALKEVVLRQDQQRNRLSSEFSVETDQQQNRLSSEFSNAESQQQNLLLSGSRSHDEDAATSPLATGARSVRQKNDSAAGHKEIPVIQLKKEAYADAWTVTETEDGKFVVSGAKIEKFARRTDLANYASVNRLRDIMKKLGIKAELTTRGARPESIINIAGKEFTLLEDY